MQNNLSANEIAIAVLTGLFLLSFIFVLDRYLIRRRSATLNANYLARVHAESSIYTYHDPQVRAVRPSEWDEFVFGGVAVRSFSRRRMVRNRQGEVVALHYEKILTPEFRVELNVLPERREPSSTRKPLLLPAAA